MTKALCIACGKMKFGVMLPCGSCGFVARSPQEWAYSFAYSDHYIEMKDLEQISRDMIESGHGAPALPPETEAEFIEAFGRFGARSA